MAKAQTNRDLLNHGAGKGDADRTSDHTAFETNMAEVQFSGVPASRDPEFKQVGEGRHRKTYGQREAATFEQFHTKIIVH